MKKTFMVDSSDQSKQYQVDYFEDTQMFVCECPDHQYRHRECKHIRLVQLFMVGEPTAGVEEIKENE